MLLLRRSNYFLLLLIWYITPNILHSQITSSYLTDLQGSTSCKPPTTYLLSLYTSWSLPLISNLPQCSTSNLRPCQDVKPSWFPKPCYTSTHRYLLLYPSLNSTLLVKLVVHDLRIQTCGTRPKALLLNLQIHFLTSPLNQDLTFITYRYTTLYIFTSLRQEIVSYALQILVRVSRSSFPHRSDTRHKTQWRNRTNSNIQGNTPSSTDIQTFRLSPFLPQTIRIKKGKTTFDLVMSVYPHYFIKAFFYS